jgi:hypothetical protein
MFSVLSRVKTCIRPKTKKIVFLVLRVCRIESYTGRCASIVLIVSGFAKLPLQLGILRARCGQGTNFSWVPTIDNVHSQQPVLP